MVTHKHHIIPRHAGGTDDPSNIQVLTIEEHAEAHRLLHEQYGRQEDLLAYQALSGMLSRQEIIQEVCRIAGKKGGAKGGRAGKGRKHSPEHIAKRTVSGERNGMYGKQFTPEQKQRQGAAVSKVAQAMGDEWSGTKNLKESTRKRMEDGTHPSRALHTCPHCGIQTIIGNITRWHGDRCKLKQ